MGTPISPNSPVTPESLSSDADAVLYKAEQAKSAYTAGTFDPHHLDEITDAAQALKANANSVIATPNGTPVPDGPTTARTEDAARLDAEARAAEATAEPTADEPPTKEASK